MRPSASVTLLTRIARPGEAKSRLIPLLGAEGAASLQHEMSAHVAMQLRLLAAAGDIRVNARITGGHPLAARHWLRLPIGRQAEGDLGHRQAVALREGLRHAPVAAVIGGDCPTVTVPLMRATLARAASDGAAVVRATDGGYCMLAVSSEASATIGALELGIEWGTPAVLRQLCDACADAGVVPVELGPVSDIDEPEDLPSWEAVRSAWYAPPQSLAVIVPVLNEAPRLPALVRALRAEGAEAIVADGGSVDGSRAAARSAGATVVKTAPGRARQMNAAARTTDADALVFLHADTVLPAGFATLVRDALSAPDSLVGAFRFSLGARTPALRLIEAGTRLRGSLAHLPYGDQALFCRRVAFEAIGGFPALPVMEDYEFVRRARRAGNVRVLPQAALTSDRRWREHGAVRWTALNIATAARYRLGTPAAELAEWRSAHSKR